MRNNIQTYQKGKDFNISAESSLDGIHVKDAGPAQLSNVKSFPPCQGESLDYYARKDGATFAGTHILVDLWGASDLDDIEKMEFTMRKCILEAGATLLHIHLHHFTPNGGISGVAVLAESHISVHTWPERSYAAFDVFMCGDAKPENCIPVLNEAFAPTLIESNEHRRGMLDKHNQTQVDGVR